ncbi:glycerol-3-phosphate dehydrogenase [Alteriqipengyuania lutimaris]|uniref:Glycerol-3-phosphate dehydrogenase n=1 Tax=Alteriqipengyuania lutimaris TaxID=1538146 RepID=A0A395LM69_9SPHN|nr:glycerol-3-phosphate dehydrogenase [Alteriqipengyuania lutimaris]MBB3035102.1 glycerol-3-phosphate dehydrogenase [Alteriqipengyuania lutimaris]RDS75720.1 glycerol-3-phosphate dehydrogenase [Alteriqipengyuania lutimaris]
MSEPFDLVVIGGGINGAGIARDAAGRGLRVLLVEKDDLAQHTSSASTKLVHGGLRYLEHYEFRLVRESLQEREVLLRNAPHIIWPLRFVLPHHSGLRPSWLLRTGLFLYDHIGGRKLLPATRGVDLRKPPHASILKPTLEKGFEYSDCWVEDSRLVVLNAVDAKERGADIRTRTECTGLVREGDLWRATLRDADGETQVTACAVVNAAGPWVDAVLGRALPGERHANLRLVKGSHLIVPKLWEGEHCYIFQNGDGRICFAIPYERDFTLLGTTDEAFDGDPDQVAISDEEAAYICTSVNEYLATEVKPGDAVSSYSGVRPLYEDAAAKASEVTRDYVFEVDDKGGAPILSVFGGKITTFRRLAEHALEKLDPGGEAWTRDAPLPGGEMPVDGHARVVAACAWTGLPEPVLARLVRAYGVRIADIIGSESAPSDLGPEIAPGVFEAELAYLRDVEFARSGEDVLWRRSKLGLHLDEAGRSAIMRWMES